MTLLERRPLQFRLTTCVVMMVTAGALMAVCSPWLQDFADSFDPAFDPARVSQARLVVFLLALPGIGVVLAAGWASERVLKWQDEVYASIAAAPDMLARAQESHRRLREVISDVRAARPEAELPAAQQAPAPTFRPGLRLHALTCAILLVVTVVLAWMSVQYRETRILDGDGVRIVQSRGWPAAWEVRIRPIETPAMPNALWTQKDWYVINMLLDVVLWLFMLSGAAAICETLARRGRPG